MSYERRIPSYSLANLLREEMAKPENEELCEEATSQFRIERLRSDKMEAEKAYLMLGDRASVRQGRKGFVN